MDCVRCNGKTEKGISFHHSIYSIEQKGPIKKRQLSWAKGGLDSEDGYEGDVGREREKIVMYRCVDCGYLSLFTEKYKEST